MAGTRTKLLYGSGSIAFGVNDQSFQYFLLIFFNQVMGLPAAWVGIAIAFAMAFDSMADPIVGQISDNLHSRWGRRHPFMYGSAIPLAISYLLLWNPPHWSQIALFYYLTVAIILVRTFITFYEIPSSSLVAELTPDYDQRTSFFAFRDMFAWIGGLTMALLAFGVFFKPDATHPVGQLNPHGYMIYSITGAIAITVAIFISTWGTHRFIPHFVVPTKRPETLIHTLRDMLETLSHRSFLVLILCSMFGAVAGGTLTALNIYFNTYFWHLSAQQIFILTFALIPAPFLAVAMVTPFSRRLGKRAAAVTLWISSTALYWYPLAARIMGVFPETGSPALMPMLIGFNTVGVTLSIACTIVISSMLADVVEDSELRTGRRSEGLFFAARSLVSKSVSGMGAMVAGFLLALVHFPAKADPATLDPSIPKHLALVYFPTVFGLYAVALVCISFYKIDRATHEENLRKLGKASA
jgi:Na+/melibiose symporter-like transporter